jgi:hypothetical protein
LRRDWGILRATGGVLLGAAVSGCSSPPVLPANPTWEDVAPIFRGECNSCHGYTAAQTGASYRFDFFDMTTDTCGDAVMALDKGLFLAGSALVAKDVKTDVVPQGGAQWPRMPPQPSPALPDWERNAIEAWAGQPVKGSPPPGNRPPTLDLYDYPATADKTLTFTAVLSDPDDNAALGVIEVNGLATLQMNRTGSFAVSFDSSSWPTGPQSVKVVLCDGWAKAEYYLSTVQIAHKP